MEMLLTAQADGSAAGLQKTSMRTFHNNRADCPALPMLNVNISHYSDVKFPEEFWEAWGFLSSSFTRKLNPTIITFKSPCVTTRIKKQEVA